MSTNTKAVKWIATILDVGDGSGDGLIELPDELLKQLEWKLGDELEISYGTRESLIIQKRTHSKC